MDWHNVPGKVKGKGGGEQFRGVNGPADGKRMSLRQDDKPPSGSMRRRKPVCP